MNGLPSILILLGGGLGLAVAYGLLRLGAQRGLDRGPFSRRLLILGQGPLARRLVEEIDARGGRPFGIAGILGEHPGGGRTLHGHPVLGSLEDLGEIARRTGATRIAVALTERRGRLPVRQLLEARARGLTVEDGLDLLERLTGKLSIEAVPPSALIFDPALRPALFHRVSSRLLSIAVALAGLVLFLPAGLVIAALIKLDSRGPILFVQERLGLGGRVFRLLKFRTMRPDDRPVSEWARDNGHRVTRIGGWLRRFRLDELPQFVNILRGDMNLVGPRPHPACNAGLFDAAIPYYLLRATIRPGVTGWAQVRQGYANGLVEETEKMRFDLHYIRRRSLRLDLRILLETVAIVLGGRESIARAPSPAVPARPIPFGLLGRAGGPLHRGVR